MLWCGWREFYSQKLNFCFHKDFGDFFHVPNRTTCSLFMSRVRRTEFTIAYFTRTMLPIKKFEKNTRSRSNITSLKSLRLRKLLDESTLAYWVLLGPSWPHWALLSLTGSYLNLLDLMGPYGALLGLTGPYWALLGLTGHYWALLRLTGPY